MAPQEHLVGEHPLGVESLFCRRQGHHEEALYPVADEGRASAAIAQSRPFPQFLALAEAEAAVEARRALEYQLGPAARPAGPRQVVSKQSVLQPRLALRPLKAEGRRARRAQRLPATALEQRAAPGEEVRPR